ncbi:hypothetical protein P167DRAFT_288827 [Morchella conica CCBAS932]|uniref:Uncharacterized protein n=1 Tax=Morchella conica CCBAS932 TaxID=1392247 RepID=A0A3N4KH07_9PEZI|nr:hypothetical protein P167DRAFT_288827 [Morchella conica CCBAS932]
MAISIDTRSEPECSSNRAMESPGPAMSIDFARPTRRTRPLPQVPPFNNSGAWESASESGMAHAPISPVSRGPHPDVGSDAGDRMEIDEIPVTTSQPMDEEPLLDTARINGNHYHSHPVSNAPPERQDQGRESYAKAEARLKRHQQLEEMHEKIKEVRILLAEYNELCNEDLEDQWGIGNRYELIAIPFSASDDSDNTIPYNHGVHYEPSPQNISLGRFLTQDPAEESPMSRLLSSGGTASTPSSTTAQADTRQLVSPPISVASPPHAAATAGEVHPQHPHHQQQQQGQHNPIVIPDDEPMNPPVRSPKVAQRGSISQQKNGPPGGTQSTHTLLPQNGKSTVCPECDKVFAMPSKLK